LRMDPRLLLAGMTEGGEGNAPETAGMTEKKMDTRHRLWV
jgi:hypothetical protein